jgi:hypothetical protein
LREQYFPAAPRRISLYLGICALNAARRIMSTRDLARITAADLADPSLDETALYKIAGARRDLWAVILGHPHCYESLADYIRHYSPGITPQWPPAVSTQADASAVSTELTSHNTPVPAVNQDSATGDGVPAVGGALAERDMAAERGNTDQSDHPRQPEWAEHASNAQSPSHTEHASNAGRRAYAHGLRTAPRWPQITLIVSGIVAAISLFLPAVSSSAWGFHVTASFMDTREGALLLALVLATIGFAIASIYVPAVWVTNTTAAVGIATGGIGIADSLITLLNTADSQTSAGIGLYSLIVASAAMAGIAIVLLTPKFRKG